NLSQEHKISRQECDEYALLSQQRWAAANKAGRFNAEITPVEYKVKKTMETLSHDEHARPQTTIETLAKLPSVFKKEGAAVKEHGLKPLAKVVSWHVTAVEPSIMGIGPVTAIQGALKKAGLTLKDMDLIEVNEAFAAQYLAVEKVLGLDRNKTNLNGGAIALGHPLGASGSRILAHLTHELQRTQGKYAIGSACIGGGQVEILELVSELIEGYEAEKCLPGFSAWSPFSIWSADKHLTDDPQCNPALETLRRHQNLIRTLTVKDSFAGQYASAAEPVILKNLRSLAVEFQPPPYRDAATEASVSARAFEIPQSLRSLELDNIQPHKIDSFLQSAFGFPNLRSLEVSGTTLSGKSAQSLWRVFPQLESLVLREVLFLDLDAIDDYVETSTFPRLSKLHLQLNNMELPPLHQVRLILSCPELTTLQWCTWSHEENKFLGSFCRLAHSMTEGHLHQLQGFHALGDAFDSLIAQILGAMGRVRSLKMHSNGFGVISFPALEPHLSTVQELDIQHCRYMTSTMVQTILCSCPVLRTLKVDRMLAKDAAQDGKNWVCGPSLRYLSLGFVFLRSEMHLQPKVFERLANLTRIEDFVMSRHHAPFWGESGLKLRLEDGLGNLSAWTRLKSIQVLDDTSVMIEQPEVAWMVDQWEDLELFSARTDDDALSAHLFQTRQIRFVTI
ncbi:3-ketoacyl-CoA thiolase, mitochondrial, partial [Mortierella alpina]